MKDYLDPPITKLKNNEPRAKMYLRARLGWLWGYPLTPSGQEQGLYWQYAYYPMPWDYEFIHIDETRLAQAGHDYNRVVSSFPKALPAIVGDTQVWKQRVQLKLQAIRAYLLGNKVDPWQALLIQEQGQMRLLRRVQALKQTTPSLSPILDNFAWWLSLDPMVLEQAVSWIEQGQESLAQLVRYMSQPMNACVCLFALSQDTTAQRAERLLKQLAHPVWQQGGIIYYLNFLQLYQYSFTHINNPSLLQSIETQERYPIQSSVHAWLEWLEQIMLLTPKERRRQLDVVLLLYKPEILELWYEWCLELEELIRLYKLHSHQHYLDQTYKKLSNKEFDAKLKSRHKLVAKQLKRVLESRPIGFGDKNNPLSAIKRYAESQDTMQPLVQINALLERLPAKSKWSAYSTQAFLIHWTKMWRIIDSSAYLRYQRVFKCWIHYLKQASSSEALVARLSPWLGLIEYYKAADHDWPYESVDYYLIYIDFVADDYERFFSDLAEFCETTPDSQRYTQAFLQFYNTTPKAWPKLNLFKALLDTRLSIDLTHKQQRLLAYLVADNYDPERFIGLLKRWYLIEHCDKPAYYWGALCGALHIVKQSELNLLESIDSYQLWKPLAELNFYLETLEQLKQEVPVLPLYKVMWPKHFDHYPIELTPALLFILRHHAKPEALAERILGQHFRNEALINQEIQVLESKLLQVTDDKQKQRLKTRLANLKNSLIEPPILSAQRLEHLSAKLMQAAILDLLVRWQQSCLESLRTDLQQALYLSQPLPEQWLEQTKYQTTLIALKQLSSPERKLAGHLLQADIDQNYPLVTAPPNAHWIARMQAKGLDLTHWLNTWVLTISTQLSNGQTLDLTFKWAESVLEVFQMGDYFGTCLSHDGCNFFSVVTNAADINKRVLYAYDNKGVVQGRCLLAISDEGHLLNFHPYSHLKSEEFNPALLKVLHHLAKELKTIYHIHGKISILMAKEWYDDGVSPLSPENPYLDQWFEFRKRVKKIPAETLLSAFRELLAPEPLTEILVWELTQLPELEKEPAKRLLIATQACEQGLIGIDMQKRLFESLYYECHTDYSNELWILSQAWLREDLVEKINDSYGFMYSGMSLLAQYQPLQFLRLMHQLKSKIEKLNSSIRHDLGVAHARALLACRRPRKALDKLEELKQLDTTIDIPQDLINECNRLLKAN